MDANEGGVTDQDLRPTAKAQRQRKQRHHQALLEAAQQQLRSRPVPQITPAGIAAQAGLSRRTVFNHFPSTHALLVAAVADLLTEGSGGLVETSAHGPTPRETIGHVLASTDFAAPVFKLAALARGVDPQERSEIHVIVAEALRNRAHAASELLIRKYPQSDPAETEMLVGSVIGGFIALFRRWLQETGGDDTPDSRKRWHQLNGLLTQLAASPSQPVEEPHDD